MAKMKSRKDGSRFLPNMIDKLANESPTKSFISVPRTAYLDEGFHDITYSSYADAINRAAWWLDEKFGKATPATFETVAYIGPNDLRQVILMVAAMKSGRKLLMLSPWASLEGKLSLMEKTKATALLFARIPSNNDQLQDLKSIKPEFPSFEVPGESTWLENKDAVSLYEYCRTWEEGLHDPVVVFTTSGTTGLPKPLVFTNSVIMSFDAMYHLQYQGQTLSTHDMTGRRIFVPFPLLHVGGWGHCLIYPVYFDFVAVIVPNKVQTADVVSMVISTTSVSATVIYPALIEEIFRKSQSFEILQGLDIVWWGGAPLSKSIGDSLSKIVDLRTKYGASEYLWPPFLNVGTENWNYLSIPPQVGMEFVARGQGLFELLVVRKAECADFQNVFELYPDTHHYYSRDLWSAHPTRENTWKYEGRVDDMTCLSTGQSVFVLPLELVMQECPLVKGVVIGGHGRRNLWMVIESEGTVSNDETHEYLKRLWPWIEKANTIATKNGRLQRHLTVVAPSEKPFPRLGKGSIDRRAVASMFERELNDCYLAPVRG
ncbi:hypothetical protein VTL71DRAFT_15541 [Oculimacula yallundae]|uniref:AMP-dependent synthetase/ligase domain-containing protein n=1 Tax=Oculimacula yallundae TaxID=86028 RepID=A0ABR4CJ20_9HELO